VSLSTCGAMTGFTFAHGTVADMTSPTTVPVHLLARDEPAATASPASSASTPSSPHDSALRSAIVSVARHYLQMARSRTPAEMEALIWRADSMDGVDHGQSCAAFASLTLALGARAVGRQSWVTGGGSYPWPLHPWADVRVQPNPASPDVVSMLQDAQAHHRWHPLGDGYQPRPGDWVLFDGHVEVLTRYTGAALYTVGGDSLPNLTVNAHRFPAPFGAQGVLGFVNNGELASAASRSAGGSGLAPAGDAAEVPGLASQLVGVAALGGSDRAAPASMAAIPGVLADTPGGSAASHAPAYSRHDQRSAGVPGTAAQQAFISLVAPGAIAAEQRYGIPAAVTIAQAIDESGWGQSELATADHNLYGIKGTGPAGRDVRPTREYENGAWATRTAPFRVYHNIAESIDDHGRLLATGAAYRHAMASRHLPDAFAAALTGVYATDPDYGGNLIALMRLYHLYRYDSATPAAAPTAGTPRAGASQAGASQAGASQAGASQAAVPGVPATGAPAGGEGIPGVAGALAFGAVGVRATTRSGQRGSESRGGGSEPGQRAVPWGPLTSARRYVARIPYPVAADFAATARGPLTRARPLYQDVASRAGIGWELLAACDWMQCQARRRYSPVQGEKLGTVNPDGTVFRTRSAALAQCANDLIELADAVYLIDLPGRRALSVLELASAFAAFRWGGLLEAHGISAMEFPYSVAGLTAQHLKMRWPDIDHPYAPDKPGARFRLPFGAVPVVLSLGYRAAALVRSAGPYVSPGLDGRRVRAFAASGKVQDAGFPDV
jgi:flagellum-specific peptidoglycan hydrolase FlgJ